MRSLVVLLLVVAGCSKGPSVAERMKGCAGAAGAAARAAEHSRLGVLAHGCPVGCDRKVLETLWRASPAEWAGIAEAACDVHCNPEERRFSADLPPEDRLTHALEQCGAAHFGLSGDETPVFSAEWVLLQRMGRWLAAHSGGAGAGDSVALYKVPLVVPLDLRAFAPGLYHVPDAERSQPAAVHAFVFVDAERLRATSRPAGRLTPTGAHLVETPWGAFPGAPMYPGELLDRLISIETLANPAGGDPDKLVVPAPLVVADAELPATRIADAVSGLSEERASGAYLGVTGPGGVLAAHAVRLDPPSLFTGLDITMDEGSYTLSVRRPEGESGGLEPFMRWWVGRNGGPVRIYVRGEATTQDLADLLDILARSGIKTANLRRAD